MANIGDRTVYIGSPDWYIGDPESHSAVLARLHPETAQYGVTSTARVEATGVYSPDPLGDPIFYEWRLVSTPPKSVAPLRVSDAAVATLEIDSVGVYGITLIVYGANGGASGEARTLLIGQPASVAYSGGIEYDVSWIWDILPDFWSRVSQADRNKVQYFWKGLQALVASDLMDVFNAKDSLSVASVQSSVFRRWLPVDLSLDVSGAKYLLGAPVSVIHTDADTSQIQASSAGAAFRGTLLSRRSVLIEGASPQRFDIGRAATITIGNTLIDTKILGVAAEESVGSTFTVESVGEEFVAHEEFPVKCGFTIKSPPYQSSILLVVDGEYVTAAADGSDVLSIRRTVVDSVSMPPQMFLEGARINGVSEGDTLRFKVVDAETNISSDLFVNISYVEGDLVALSPNYGPRAVLGLFSSEEGLDALYESSKRISWRGRHCGVWLSDVDTLRVATEGQYGRSFRAEPLRIYRRTRVRIDDDIRSLFRLTSRVARVESDEGAITLPSGQVITPTDETVDAYENLDFYIRNRFDYGYRLHTTNELDVLEADGYDFAMAAISAGDALTVITTVGVGAYTVVEVNASSVRVTPAPRLAFRDAEFFVSSPVSYLEFTRDTLAGRLVDKLWAEYAVVDNSERVESMYGAPLGLGRAAWERRGMGNTYRDAVAALVRARVSASTVDAIDDIASLAVGIPVAPYTSIIRNIDEEYRLNEAGEPVTVRVILEQLDSDGVPSTRLTAHDIAATNSGRLSETSGIAPNPATGSRYVVGDTVRQYSTLGEGVRVLDLYSSDNIVVFDDVLDRHRFGVVVDVDSAPRLATSSDNLGIVTKLVSDVKPAHTDFFIRILKFLVDDITIESDVSLKIRASLFDNPYHHRGPANIFDDDIPGMADRDSPPHLVLTTWFPRDGELESLGGDLYLLTSETGGFLAPEAIQGFDATGVYPWLTSGDMVELRGPSRARLTIIDVVDDNSLRISISVGSQVSNLTTPTSEDHVPFFVYRVMSDMILSSEDIDVDERLNVQVLSPSGRNIGAGDHITLHGELASTGRLRVLGTRYDAVTGVTSVSVFPRKDIQQPMLADIRIFREQVSDRSLKLVGDWIPFPRPNHHDALIGFTFPTPPLATLGVQPGDLVSYDGGAGYVAAVRGSSLYMSELTAEHHHGHFHYQGDAVVTVSQGGRSSRGDDLDEHEGAVMSAIRAVLSVKVTVYPTGAVRVEGEMGEYARAGDILYLGESRTVDIGEGRGIVRLCAELLPGLFITSTSPQSPISAPAAEFPIVVEASLIRQDRLQSEYFISPSEDHMYPGDVWGREHWRRV